MILPKMKEIPEQPKRKIIQVFKDGEVLWGLADNGELYFTHVLWSKAKVPTWIKKGLVFEEDLNDT